MSLAIQLQCNHKWMLVLPQFGVNIPAMKWIIQNHNNNQTRYIQTCDSVKIIIWQIYFTMVSLAAPTCFTNFVQRQYVKSCAQ